MRTREELLERIVSLKRQRLALRKQIHKQHVQLDTYLDTINDQASRLTGPQQPRLAPVIKSSAKLKEYRREIAWLRSVIDDQQLALRKATAGKPLNTNLESVNGALRFALVQKRLKHEKEITALIAAHKEQDRELVQAREELKVLRQSHKMPFTTPRTGSVKSILFPPGDHRASGPLTFSLDLSPAQERNLEESVMTYDHLLERDLPMIKRRSRQLSD